MISATLVECQLLDKTNSVSIFKKELVVIIATTNIPRIRSGVMQSENARLGYHSIAAKSTLANLWNKLSLKEEERNYVLKIRSAKLRKANCRLKIFSKTG